MENRINMSEWMEGIIQNNVRQTIPIMTHPGIEIIGKTVKDAVQNGTIHAQAIKALSDKYSSAATTVIMDLTVEAEAFGCKIEFPKDDMPHIIGNLVNTADEIEKLNIPPLTAGRIAEYIEANRLTVENIPEKPVFAGVIGPFSLAGRLYGMSEIMVACYLELDAITMLLDKCTRFITEYCSELKRVGCAGVVIAEPAAGLLSNDDCLLFSSVYVKAIIDNLQDDSFMVTLHNCGNRGHCTNAMLFTGANSYHFGNAMNMVEALEQCPQDVLVMGNIDPVGILKMMTPEEVKAETFNLLEKTSVYPNYILSTGCDVPPHIPLANIQAYYEALDQFNKK